MAGNVRKNIPGGGFQLGTSLGVHDMRYVRQAAESDGVSVSAWVREAIKQRIKNETTL